jgi:LAS superfamily LD-carboxypeptidase LdcB
MARQHEFDPLQLTGRTATHVVSVAGLAVQLHREVVEPFLALRQAARRSGIDLQPVSGFRDFARQLLIWNAKCRGERELLGPDGKPVDARQLDTHALVDAILSWSALPGGSRHHWGTDLDVIDAAALGPGARARLVTEEFASGGVFAHLDRWLGEHAADFGFYRPYALDRGGVRPEPWHLSHAAVAERALQGLSLPMLREALAGAGLQIEAAVLERLPEIYQRYIRNVDPVPPAALAAAALSPAPRPS